MMIRKVELKENSFNFYPIGDIHIGSINFNEQRFKTYVEYVKKDKNAKFVVIGDITDEDRPTTRLRRLNMFVDRKEAFQLHFHDGDKIVLKSEYI